jgi:preprotein translocase subunit SecB
MTMTEKFKILAKFIKDASSETADIETYLFVKENISKYQLNIDITSKPLKNKLIEINTTLKFEDKEPNEKKSYYEIVYTTIIKVNDEIKDKKNLEKIILCDVPTKIYPELETSFLNLMHNSGHSDIKLEKKIDFNKLYSERFN